MDFDAAPEVAAVARVGPVRSTDDTAGAAVDLPESLTGSGVDVGDTGVCWGGVESTTFVNTTSA